MPFWLWLKIMTLGTFQNDMLRATNSRHCAWPAPKPVTSAPSRRLPAISSMWLMSVREAKAKKFPPNTDCGADVYGGVAVGRRLWMEAMALIAFCV